MSAQKKLSGKVGLSILVDVLLALCFVTVMATALVQEVAHEYLGLLIIVLMVVHVVLNRRWFASLAKGRYTPVRVLQLIAIVGLAACIIGQVVSAVVLSKHALGFLPAVPGASWARQVHMLCSYWSFVFAFAHAGLQFRNVLVRTGLSRRLQGGALWVLRILWLAIAAFGIVSFVHVGMADYLFARVMFAAADYSAPLALTFARYAAIALLIAGAFHYLRIALSKAARAS